MSLFAVLGIATANTHAQDAKFELKKGDHISYLGNTLPDRMQHHGWLETLLQHRLSGLDIVVRSLGFSADELNTRPRSSNFGSPDKHLTHSETDVLFAFFGYNEAQAGEAGLKNFRTQLGQFIDATLAQKYNGESAPRLVLFSPMAHEDLQSPHFPDGKENNQRLEMYTKAMSEVAGEKKVAFVDLFHPTKKLFESSDKPLTINGIHLTVEGSRKVAEIIDRALFGEPPSRREADLEKIRQAVLDKNLHWFNRYRVTDGYSVYGGRSKTGNYDGQTNFTIMERELQILDVMTANRDKRIWALAKGSDLKVDDSNTPKPLTIKTNRPGPNPDGSHKFLSGVDAIDKMVIHKGMSVNLFASEEMFPELINPVQSAVDPDGRLWVAAWPTYPHWNPKKVLNDKLIILPDEDNDGKADKAIVFADQLHNPTGFEFWGGGVLVAQAPDILFLKDTDGDDKADVRVRIMHGLDSADTHHTANSFVIGPDGWLNYQRGVFHYTNIESPWGAPFRSSSTGVYRFHPRTHRSEFHFAVGPNPHGDVFDRWGNQFATDGTGGKGYHIAIPRHKASKELYVKQYRPVAGTGLIAGSHFPEEHRGNFLICNCIGFQGVAQYKFVDQGSGFHCEPVEPIFYSKDPNFRPTSVKIGGDGALYVTDWQNPLIGHLQHNLRDPNRDHRHGRVYRVTVDGRPLRKVVKMMRKPIEEVAQQILSKDHDVRYRAKLELTGRDSKAVAAAVSALADKLDAAEVENAQPLIEALWVHHQNGIVNEALLKKVVQSSVPGARSAAIRVLREWHDKIDDTGALLWTHASDPNPRVRAEAVISAMYYQGPESAEVIFAVAQLPQDNHLTFVLNEARKSIDVDGYIKDAVANGKPLSKAAQLYMLRNAGVNELMKLDPSEAVYQAILSRPKANAKQLSYALAGLAKIRKTSEVKLLLDLVAAMDANESNDGLSGATTLLGQQSRVALQSERDRLQKLAKQGKTATARRLGYVGWIIADDNGDDALRTALKSKESLRDLLESIGSIEDDAVRSKLYADVRSLMLDLPTEFEPKQGGSSGSPGLRVDYYLPHPAQNVALTTLSKAKPTASWIGQEVSLNMKEITTRDAFALRFTGTIQIDRRGKYTFFLMSDDGSRLYVGGEEIINNDGLHGKVEKQGSINLTPGSHPIVVTYFDNGGGDGLNLSWNGPGIRRKSKIPASKFSTGSGQTLYDVAVEAMGTIPGHEAEKFADLSKLFRSGRSRTSAVAVLSKLPKQSWPKKEVRPLVDSLLAYLSQTPARYRTSPTAMQAIALTKALATALPSEQAKRALTRLENLDVRIVAIGTVPHRMIYDVNKIVVEAGKPVEIRFSNIDSMPHNLAIAQPGSMEQIGMLAEMTGTGPDAMKRHYIPKSDKILLSSILLQPGDSQTLSFEAPKQPGVYPVVCTYPGHWRRMYAALYVVGNVEAYQADPDGYLASNKLEIEDPLLATIGKTHDWKLEELIGSVKPLEHGRSFEVGKNAFTVSACVSCHRMGSTEGQQVGPDLTKLDAMKSNPEHILKSLLNPSETIDEKFQSYVFELSSGQVLTGMILEETPDTLTVIDNPLAKSKPIVLKKSAIEAKVKSPKSIMPEGLLSKLTREEVLDLIAYVYAKGDKKHKLFAGHEH